MEELASRSEAKAANEEPKAQPFKNENINEVAEAYSSHIYSLLFSIFRRALVTPSLLWLRGALLPIIAFYLSYQTGSVVPWALAALALGSVPVLVAFFIWLQLAIIVRRATDGDLSHKLNERFSEKGSHFFVISLGGRVVGCLGVRKAKGGQAELQYFAVRPDLSAEDKDVAAEALLSTAISHARRAGFTDLFIKLNSAETQLLAVAKRAGFGKEQLIRISAWFHAHRLMLVFKKGQ